ncbi:MAG: hypothetical protein U1F63_00250 [Chitinivorax sp.]
MMHKMKSLVLCLGLFGAVAVQARDFQGLFTTDSVPGGKCKITEAAPKLRHGNYLGSRSDAYNKVNESLELFVAEIKQDGFDAVIGFRPGINGSAANDSNAMFTWVYAGVAVKCGK